MDEVVARYEYRIFAAGLGLVEERLRALADCEAIQESREVYLLWPGALDRNVKLRGGGIELKLRIGQEDGLERWRPAGRWEFPLAAAVLHERLLAGLDEKGCLPRIGAALSRNDLLGSVVPACRDLVRANLFKRRFRFTLSGCATEIDDVRVNGAALASLAIEAEDPQAVLAARARLGLEGRENVAYPLAVARVLGLAPLPDGDRYG